MTNPPSNPNPPFARAMFFDYLRTTASLSVSVANTYADYTRAAVNAGQDPFDNAAFSAHVSTYAPTTRSRRRSSWRHYQRFVGAGVLLPDAPVHGSGVLDARDELSDFARWLETDRGYTASTSQVYASAIRTALRVTGDDPTRDQIEDLLGQKPMAYRSRFPGCWKLWRTYTKGAAVSLEVSDNTPDAVAYCVWYLATRIGMQLKHVRELTWQHLREDPDGTTRIAYLPDLAAGRYYRQAIDSSVVLEVLRQWSLPFDDESPLVPVERGSTALMNRKQIHDIADRGARLSATAGFRPQSLDGARPDLGNVPWSNKTEPEQAPQNSNDWGEAL